MQLNDFIAVMERIAPPELACDFDNPGLLIGPVQTEITRVLVALDCTVAVAREAADRGVHMVLTHHPLFFTPVRRILPDDPETSAAYALIRAGVGLYAAHTNLDSASGGVNDTLAALFGLTGVTAFGDGMGRIGSLSCNQPPRLDEFVRTAEEKLHTKVRFSGDPAQSVHRVAVLGGAGGDAVAEAYRAGADVLITGEVKHHQALAAQSLGIALVVGGHDETERVVLAPLIKRLQRETNDVQYELACSDVSPLVQL